MKKFTPRERSELRAQGYSDEEILRMEMEMEEEVLEGGEEEFPTNAQNMRSVPWNELKAAGQSEPKRAAMMGGMKRGK
jgi:hypothetical protein